jgi:inward rectifier potassium channel
MRDRWFHEPTLHTSSDPVRRTSWLELLYDLIFVAGVIQLADAVAGSIGELGWLNASLWFAVYVSPMWIAWTGYTFYSNRYNVDDIIHRLLVFAHMLATAGMGVMAPLALRTGGDQVPFTIAYSTAQALLAVMFWRSLRHTEEGKPYSRFWAAAFAAGALVWALALLVEGNPRYGVWAVGVLLIVAAPLSRPSRALQDGFPIDQAHLSERYGFLTIVVLGEGFVRVLGELASGGRASEPASLLCGSGLLLITIGVWWIYFDDVAGSRLREGRIRWLIWLYAHWPMALFLVGIGVAMELIMGADPLATITADQRWLLGGNLAGAFAMVAAVDSVTERRQAELSDAWRVRARYAFAVVLVLLAGGGAGLSVGVFVASCVAICVGQVVIDMMMAPHADQAHTTDAPTTAELARQQQARGERTQRAAARQRVGGAVRLGAPPELRHDLYFWLMEGSWARLVALIVGAYLSMNAVFAGLYLMVDGTITNAAPGSFVDAFAFSVQTMSTIGYGAMAPATPYAHLLVTIEAATGMLGVALATGLMFARASRPEAKMLFSEPFVITQWHGQPTLMFRVGNARGNEVMDASVSVSVLHDEISAEGHHLRRLHDLELVRSRTPIFQLSWTVMHVIDARSPLREVDWSDPERLSLTLVVILSGHDATYAQTVHARHVYQPEDARVGHGFVDVVRRLPDGRLLIDYTHMHDTVPAAGMGTGEASGGA